MRKSPWLMSVSPQIEKRQKPETRVYRVGVFAASAHLLMPLSFMLCCTPSLELVTETDTGIVGRSPVRPIGDRAAGIVPFCSPVGTLDEAVLHPRRHHVGVRIANWLPAQPYRANRSTARSVHRSSRLPSCSEVSLSSALTKWRSPDILANVP